MKGAYYNDISAHCCEWLRRLMWVGAIPEGAVDERSIAEVDPDYLRQFRQCHFFAGLGGWALAARMAGWPEDRPLWTGSLPCQPWSCAGLQRGANDERDLWHHQLRLIAECKPATFFGEQVASAVPKGWLDRAHDDLEAIGYACGAVIVPAAGVGAPHKRDRLWLVADAEWNEQPRQESCGRKVGRVGGQLQSLAWDADWESAFARLRALDDGLPRNVAGTDAARNAIVPQIAAQVIAAYMEAV